MKNIKYVLGLCLTTALLMITSNYAISSEQTVNVKTGSRKNGVRYCLKNQVDFKLFELVLFI